MLPHESLSPKCRFLPFLWAGFWLNAASGVLLLIGYPTKALNPVFYLKLTLIAVAMVLLLRISRARSPRKASPRRLIAIFRRGCARWRSPHSFAGRSDHGWTSAGLHLYPATVALTMHDFQVWLVTTIYKHSPVADLMRTGPGVADRREPALSWLVSAGRRHRHLRSETAGHRRKVPIAAVHASFRGVWPFADPLRDAVHLREPDQYIYNPSFHFKLLFMTIGGLNAATFYLTSYRRIFGPNAPRCTKRAVIAAISLCAWIGVITGGRLLTFYRPAPCDGRQTSLLLACQP